MKDRGVLKRLGTCFLSSGRTCRRKRRLVPGAEAHFVVALMSGLKPGPISEAKADAGERNATVCGAHGIVPSAAKAALVECSDGRAEAPPLQN